MTVTSSNAKTTLVTLDLANGGRVTIISSDAAEPQEAAIIVVKKDSQGATDQQVLTLHEGGSDDQFNPADTATPDLPDKVTTGDPAPDGRTQAAGQIQVQCANRAAVYEEYYREVDVVNTQYMRRRRNALIFHGRYSTKYRAEVAKTEAIFQQEMVTLIAKYAAVQGFDVDFERRVVDVELARSDDRSENTRFAIAAIMVLIIAYIFY